MSAPHDAACIGHPGALGRDVLLAASIVWAEAPSAARWADLAAARPALADALAARPGTEERLDAAAALIARADDRLVDLLVPASPAGALADRVGEDPQADLWEADVRLDGTWLVGTVRGQNADRDGVWVGLDTRGGPALDLVFGFGRGWAREAAFDGPPGSPAMARDVFPQISANAVSFRVDLSGSSRFDPDHAGTAVAMMKSADGYWADPGPAGVLGTPPDGAVDVLLAIVDAGPVADADLAVALAVTFGSLRAIVAPDVRALVEADAVGWLRYGEGVDAWLAEQGALWRLGTLDALGKLVWAWPAAQAVAYGAFPLATAAEPLDAARYRFDVPDAATLQRLRKAVPVRASAAETAAAIDAGAWARLRYRARDDLMRELCRTGELTGDECDGWRADRKAGADLGEIGGVRVAIEEGVSTTLQLDVLAREGAFVGDCATATTIAIHTMQAFGLPALAMGWAGGGDWSPTHDVPLWYDGARFRGTQRGPGPRWAKDAAFVYVLLPGVHPVAAFSLGREPDGWSRGGAVAGGMAPFADVSRILREGLRGEVVGAWIDAQAAGGWPTW